MKHRVSIPHCLFILVLVALLSACAAQTKHQAGGGDETVATEGKLTYSSSNQMETIRSRGTLRVGVSIFVPWIMHSNKGKLIGYEADVAGQLAKDLGVKVEFIQTSWAAIIPDLLADRYDIIISGLSLTPQRALMINFSEPYSHSSSVLIASRKLAGTLTDRKQFNTKDITIAVVKGSTGEKILTREFPKAGIKVYDSESQVIAALLSGKIQAMVSSTPKTGYLLSRHDKELFQPFTEPLAVYAEGFGIRKGDSDFLNFLNTWIRVNTQNEWLPERHHYWFDTIEWADQL
jgi:polar amino acid transport system substrate-binding protein